MEVRALGPDPKKDPGFRVNVELKRRVNNQIMKYKDLLKTLLEGQSQLRERDREKLTQEMLRNFEQMVQENIIVDGLSWEEAAEEDGTDCEASSLDDMLDEKILDTTRKRSIYPKEIRACTVRSLKAERKLMGLLENTVVPQEVKRDPAQDTIMNNLFAAAPGMFNQASTVIKSLQALKQTAEGLQQILDMQPSAETLEVCRDIFGSSNDRVDSVLWNREPANRHITKRAVPETEYSLDYVPLIKTPSFAKID